MMLLDVQIHLHPTEVCTAYAGKEKGQAMSLVKVVP